MIRTTLLAAASTGLLFVLGCPDNSGARPADSKPADSKPADAKTAPSSAPAGAAPSSAPAGGNEAAPSSQPTKTGKGTTPADRDQVDPDGVVRRGRKLASAAPLSIKDCSAKAGELNGKEVTVAGTVEKVCVKKGCWFAIADQGESIRVTMKDYGFFVPSSAVGKKAVVSGVLEVKELSEEEAKHLAEDGGKDPATVTGPQKELRIISAGLEMHPLKS